MKRLELIIAFFIVLISVILMALIYFDLISVGFVIGPYRFNHWASIIGAFYLSIITPVFVLIKRSKPGSLRNLLKFHVFGNLLAFLLISVHFAGRYCRQGHAGFHPAISQGPNLLRRRPPRGDGRLLTGGIARRRLPGCHQEQPAGTISRCVGPQGETAAVPAGQYRSRVRRA